MEYYIKYQGWFLQVVSYVIWIDQCVKHEIDDKKFEPYKGMCVVACFITFYFYQEQRRVPIASKYGI